VSLRARTGLNAPKQLSSPFDHFVRGGEHPWRDREPSALATLRAHVVTSHLGQERRFAPQQRVFSPSEQREVGRRRLVRDVVSNIATGVTPFWVGQMSGGIVISAIVRHLGWRA
jgi:hypothetical protein